MRKTSVYLPEPLKEALGRLADRSGRSEAQLIRQAIERLVAAAEVGGDPHERPRPSPAARPGPRLSGVGVGPGDAGLLTRRAVDVLTTADRVLAPTIALDAVGRAEAIVRQATPDVAVERVVFVMEVASAARDAALEAAADRIVELVDRGEHVAFVTLGDPSVYSTFSALADLVAGRRPGLPIDAVPGIMAFQELAARARTTVVDGAERLALLSLLDAPGGLDAALQGPEQAVVIYKGGRHLPAIAERLAAHGRLEGAVVGELLGLPGERLAPVAAAADRPASYLATVVVPPRRAALPSAGGAGDGRAGARS